MNFFLPRPESGRGPDPSTPRSTRPPHTHGHTPRAETAKRRILCRPSRAPPAPRRGPRAFGFGRECVRLRFPLRAAPGMRGKLSIGSYINSVSKCCTVSGVG